MVNKSYVKGRAKEYRIMNRLRSEGYEIVLRSAGSHGPIDIVAISHSKAEIRLIQSKPRSMNEAAKKRLEQTQIKLNKPFNVTYEVI